MEFENKMVAIVNKKIDVGVAMNAIAHMAIGFGANMGREPLKLNDYEDKEGNRYPNISQMPFIILKGKTGEIRKALEQAKENAIDYSVFTDTMTGGTFQEQLENTKATLKEALTFYGAILFGPIEKVNAITKKFSLYQ